MFLEDFSVWSFFFFVFWWKTLFEAQN